MHRRTLLALVTLAAVLALASALRAHAQDCETTSGAPDPLAGDPTVV